MINTKPDRQLRGCLHKGAMDESNTCSGEHGRPLSAIPCMLLPLAHYPDTTPFVLPQISTLKYLCTRPAMRIGWIRIARWLNTTDCEGPFRGVGRAWGGGRESREASYREWSRVSEPRRCARVTTHPSLRENDHMVMPVGTRGWLATVCTRHSV